MEGNIFFKALLFYCVLGSLRLIFDTGFCRVSSDGELQLHDAVSYIHYRQIRYEVVSIFTEKYHSGQFAHFSQEHVI